MGPARLLRHPEHVVGQVLVAVLGALRIGSRPAARRAAPRSWPSEMYFRKISPSATRACSRRLRYCRAACRALKSFARAAPVPAARATRAGLAAAFGSGASLGSRAAHPPTAPRPPRPRARTICAPPLSRAPSRSHRVFLQSKPPRSLIAGRASEFGKHRQEAIRPGPVIHLTGSEPLLPCGSGRSSVHITTPVVLQARRFLSPRGWSARPPSRRRPALRPGPHRRRLRGRTTCPSPVR